MLVINLLAWRTENSIYQKEIIKRIIFFSAVFMSISSLSMHTWLGRQINFLEIECAFIKEKIHQLERPTLAVSKINERLSMHILRNIADYRAATANLFIALGVPSIQRVCFTQIVRNKEKINFSGRAYSLADLMQFLQTWRGAYLFSEIKMGQLKQQDKYMQFNFSAFENVYLESLDS